jgi:toxin YoeB
MRLVVDRQFLEDLRFWVSSDARVAERILRLVEEVRRDPFRGTGKPEPLKHLGAGVWSRRITQADRLVYLVESGTVNLLQCRYHY